ncbi:MAG: hypothetical protein ABSB30_01215 [Terracidiphilus sp.]|jgi:hypothetical protein
MNWRRGLLLAGIHLAVAGTLIVWEEVEIEQHSKSLISNNTKTVQMDATQEGETVSFRPCGMWVEYSPQFYIVQFANIPAFILTDWQDECPPYWTLSGILHADREHRTVKSQRQVDIGLVIIIALQWFLLGGFPLIQPRRWWWEPGAFITLCTLAAFVIVLIPVIDAASKLPMLFALLAWLWWFGLLVWKSFRYGWRLARRVIAHGR